MTIYSYNHFLCKQMALATLHSVDEQEVVGVGPTCSG